MGQRTDGSPLPRITLVPEDQARGARSASLKGKRVAGDNHQGSRAHREGTLLEVLRVVDVKDSIAPLLGSGSDRRQEKGGDPKGELEFIPVSYKRDVWGSPPAAPRERGAPGMRRMGLLLAAATLLLVVVAGAALAATINGDNGDNTLV